MILNESVERERFQIIHKDVITSSLANTCFTLMESLQTSMVEMMKYFDAGLYSKLELGFFWRLLGFTIHIAEVYAGYERKIKISQSNVEPEFLDAMWKLQMKVLHLTSRELEGIFSLFGLRRFDDFRFTLGILRSRGAKRSELYLTDLCELYAIITDTAETTGRHSMKQILLQNSRWVPRFTENEPHVTSPPGLQVDAIPAPDAIMYDILKEDTHFWQVKVAVLGVTTRFY